MTKMGTFATGWLRAVRRRWGRLLRPLRCRGMRRRLAVPAPSILSNDCVGGVMAHDLGLPFRSPTVNLFFDSVDGFLTYVAGIGYYRSAPLLDGGSLRQGGRRYPVGLLAGSGRWPELKIHFLHYASFDHALKKWRERSERIDPAQLCVVLHAKRMEPSELERFLRLPVERKVVLGYPTLPLSHPSIFKLHSLREFAPGRILDFRGWTGRRYLDDFDFVSFLNGADTSRSGA